MTQTLSDKRVFVTGGASGIGRAIVIAFVERGARVAFCDVNETAARSLLEYYPQLIFYPADVTDAEVLNRVVNTVINPKSVIRISQCCMAVRNPLFFPIWKEMTALFLKTVPDKGYAFLLSCPNRLALISTHNGWS